MYQNKVNGLKHFWLLHEPQELFINENSIDIADCFFKNSLLCESAASNPWEMHY